VLRLKPLLLFLFLALSLAGCESAEERAEKHFRSAMTLLEQGDEERAILEFKNVFKLNGQHREARIAYAELQRRRGNLREAIAQNLLLAEQFPQDGQARRTLAELYAELGNWREMGRFLEEAARLMPEDPRIAVLQLVLDYRNRIENGDGEARRATAARARALVEQMPDSIMLRRIVIDDLVRRELFEEALAELDAAIEIAPDDRRLYEVRLPVLAALGDVVGVERQLRRMIELFPDDETAPRALVRWLVAQGELDRAEEFLRERIGSAAAPDEGILELIAFLERFRGQEVAVAELDRILADGRPAPTLRGLRAGYRFDMGAQEAAIAELRGILDGLEPSEEQRKLLLVLARMLEETGDRQGAEALVDQVLEADPVNVGALKTKAGWLIAADRAGDAILLLRTALENAPRDTDIPTMLARAHEREGNRELVGEMLALAYDLSDSAPAETLRYARFLQADGRRDTAEKILIDALRLAPDNMEILIALGELHVSAGDWPRAEQVQQALRRLGTPLAEAAANDLRSRILQGQNRRREAIAFLEALLESGDAGFGAHVEIVRSHLSAGEREKARAYVDALLAEDPGDVAVRFLDTSLRAALEEYDAAVEGFRGLLAENPEVVQGWVGLYRVLLRAGREAEARALVDEALAALPQEPVLLWMKAGVLEAEGDIPGAIEIYEDLYARDSGNLIVANNLASLLSNLEEDPAALERAGRIAQRLRGSDFPPYQDTYGWIALMRGETGEALAALEPAARGLADDPLVQYHLARAYLAAGRSGAALRQFERVLSLVGEDDRRAFVQRARQEAERLRAAAAAGDAENGAEEGAAGDAGGSE